MTDDKTATAQSESNYEVFDFEAWWTGPEVHRIRELAYAEYDERHRPSFKKFKANLKKLFRKS